MLLGFQDRFVSAVMRGEKTHTIRGERAVPIEVGDRLDLYKRPRQKGMKLLFRAPCVKVERIDILVSAAGPEHEEFCKEFGMQRPNTDQLYRAMHLACSTVIIDDHGLSPDEIEQLARRDGFSNFHEMLKFWSGRLPFEGTIIHWDYAKRTRKK
jgi:hypothetical protein